MEGNKKIETPLCKLALKYGTDKCPEFKHNYTPYYFQIFKKIRDSVSVILEMGIGHYPDIKSVDIKYDPRLKRWYQKGASLKMWRDFFPKARVIGADIKKETLFKDKRIETYLCDQSNPNQVKNLIKKINQPIDIFIDDGNHNKNIQVSCAKSSLPYLPKEVIYIIEDVDNPHYVISHLKNYQCFVPNLTTTINFSAENGFTLAQKRFKDDTLVLVKNKK